MGAIQNSLNQLVASSLGAAFGATNAGPIREIVAKKAKVANLLQITEAGKSAFSAEGFNSQEGVEQQMELTEDMERATMELAMMEKNPERRAKLLEGNIAARQGLTTLGEVHEAIRRPNAAERAVERQVQAQQNAAERQAQAQQQKADVEKAVERRRAILQGLPADRREELMNGK